uniref:Phosphatidic acid phosphatase type 2/haloperoxidase domain-containing protein n=1 Tax=Meloidogyne enterolobii TaxID=390850 RepID=A0A6V7XBS8_MELEN|nr:unnamed protein product [Meloidogyne enterolobii]
MPSPQWSEQFGSVSHLGVNSESATTNKFQINYFLLPNFIIHIVGLAALWALWYYLRLTNVFPYHHRVFYCRDVYVSYPLLYLLAFLIPPIVILIGELMFWLFSTKPRKIVYATCGECKIALITRRIFRFISIFMFGALVTQIFVDTIKLLTGYQRPYFLSLCNVSLASCTAPLEHSPSPSPHLACNYRNADELRYAWLTFPSLHAAFSSYSACFASCYIYYMINLRGAPLLRPMLIFGLFGMALVDSFSRINGYKNHWRYLGWLDYWFCYCYFSEPEAPPPPFFSWFRLPRVRAPSVKEEYVVYEEDVPTAPTISPPTAGTSHRKNRDRTYEVTTTTESFHRTIVPPGTSQQQRNNKNGGNNNGGNGGGGGGGGYAAPY